MAKPEKKEAKLIRIISNRPGDIVMKNVTIKFQDVVLVDEETAQWLLKTYPKEIKAVE